MTAVELLPVQHYITEPAVADRGLVNYWGYNTIAFLAPESTYSASGERGQQITEFKQMVKNFHAAGIEVILDVVYNHTAEGGPDGPSYSFRGLDDVGFYKRSGTVGRRLLGRHRLRQHRRRHQPRRAAADHGLAALLGDRDARRRVPLRPRLGAGAHRARRRHARRVPHHDQPGPGAAARQAHRRAVGRVDGRLPGRARSRRRGWSGTTATATRCGTSGAARARSATWPRGWPGPSDLYADDGRSPYTSVNFVTAHDGFTLRDLVSYDAKHNEANGEGNRDGTNDNRSWNHGVEGETDDAEIVALRHRQAANLMATLLPLVGLTDADRRRRARPHPGRQQQRLLPGQRDLVGRLATRRRLAGALRDHQDRAAAAARAPRAATAAPLRGRADDRRRPQGPRLDPPRGPRDGRAGLVRRDAAGGRDVRLRRPAALPRPARRAAARLVVPDLAQQRTRRRRHHPAGEPVGQPRRGGAVHRHRQLRSAPPSPPATR